MSVEARRHSPRVKLNETAYINFGASGYRGMVVDVSEGGLRFKTATALETAKTVHFRLASEHASDGVADLAWTNTSRTVGGLRFTSVPPEIRSQIRKWIEGGERTPRRVAAAAGVNAGAVAEGEKEAAAEFSREGHVGFGEAAASSARPGFSEKENPLSMFPGEKTSSGGYAYLGRQRSGAHRIASAVLVILFALVAVVGVLTYLYPAAMLRDMSRLEDKVTKFINPGHKEPISNVEPASMAPMQLPLAPAPPAPDLDARAQAAPPTASGSAATEPSEPLKPAGEPGGSASGAGDADSPQARNNSQADLTLAQSYLAEGSTPSQKAKGVELLWLATEKGNVDAEIQLADLYTRGVAVQKSCVQARILLKAAAAANPGAAQEKLQQLDSADCQ